jgi:hypothetical protein
LAFAAAGLLMKLADLSPGTGGGLRGPAAGALSGLALAFLMSSDPGSSAVVLAILAGSLAAGKADCPSHWAGLAAVVLGALALGAAPPSFWLLALLSLAAYLDEALHDAAHSAEGALARGWALSCRPLLKLGGLAAAALGSLPWAAAFGVLAFDAGYLAAEALGRSP